MYKPLHNLLKTTISISILSLKFMSTTKKNSQYVARVPQKGLYWMGGIYKCRTQTQAPHSFTKSTDSSIMTLLFASSFAAQLPMKQGLMYMAIGSLSVTLSFSNNNQRRWGQPCCGKKAN